MVIICSHNPTPDGEFTSLNEKFNIGIQQLKETYSLYEQQYNQFIQSHLNKKNTGTIISNKKQIYSEINDFNQSYLDIQKKIAMMGKKTRNTKQYPKNNKGNKCKNKQTTKATAKDKR